MAGVDVSDPRQLRKVFGVWPSGVTAVAALVDDRPAGITASSFTSVSLDPALVSVCIRHDSTTFSLLRTAPRLGVSILSADQAHVGRQLAIPAPDRFAGLEWWATPQGAVRLAGASGWIDASIEQRVRAGDHDIVVMAVHGLEADHDLRPLVFHAGRYCGLGD